MWSETQSYPGVEFWLLIPFPRAIIITLSMPPSDAKKKLDPYLNPFFINTESKNIYIYLYFFFSFQNESPPLAQSLLNAIAVSNSLISFSFILFSCKKISDATDSA